MLWKILLGVVVAVVALVAILEFFVVSVSVLLFAGLAVVAAVITAVVIKMKKHGDEQPTGATPSEHGDR